MRRRVSHGDPHSLWSLARRSARRARCRAAAFSLIELLTVIAIMVLLMGLAAPALNSLGRSTGLTVTAQQVVDQFNVARQQAITRNRLVEVRFYKVPDEADPAAAYRALRLLVLNPDGSVQSADRVQKFQKGVAILDKATYSTMGGFAASTTNETLPGFGSSPYVYFRLRPDGSTDLDASAASKWFLTLVNLRETASSTNLPPNFATIQIDPVTGRPKLFRP
jgi:uncharacterized protein (TIGR02596 family)